MPNSTLKGNDAIWAAVRKLRDGFTAADIRGELSAASGSQDIRIVYGYLARLVKGGYVSFEPAQGRERGRYSLIDDVGSHAPRLGRDGRPCNRGQKRRQLWRTITILGEFSARELQVTASTEDHPIAYYYAQRYCGHLALAGVLVSSDSRPMRYQLVPKYRRGPNPPRVLQRVQIVDGNTGTLLYLGPTQEAA